MSFRKWIPICIFLAGAILGRPMALGTVGFIAKSFFYFEKGWRFSYGSVDWHEGKLIFKEIDLKTCPQAESSFSLHAKRVFVCLGARHLEIEKPVVDVRGMPRLKGGSSEWTLDMKDGIIKSDEFGDLRFSFEKTWPHHLGSLVLEKQGSLIAIEAIQEKNEIWFDADLHQFETDSLKHWIDLRGVADGKVHLVFEGNECKRGSLHLDFREAGYGPFFSDGVGTIDWEGDVGGDFFSKCLGSLRLRLQLSNANVTATKGGIENIKGDLSFMAGVGAKWEFGAKAVSKGESFPIQWSGKTFLHHARPFWAESVATCHNARFSLRGQQEADGVRWKGEGDGIGAVEGTLIQSLWALVDPRLEGLEFEQGTIRFKGETLYQKEWEIAFKAENLACRNHETALQCQMAEIEWNSQANGTLQFSGASSKIGFSNGKTISGNEWQGSAAIEQGILVRSHFAGKLENRAGEATLSGTLEGFRLEAKGSNFEIALKCAWKERLDFLIEKGRCEGLSFGGTGWMAPEGSFSLHIDNFDGPLSPLCRAIGSRNEMEGRIQSIGSGFFAEGNFLSYDWFLQAKGELGSGLGFYCPFFEKKDRIYSFDVRIETPTWDIVRLSGSSEMGRCNFDSRRTHLMGLPVQVDSCIFDGEGLASLQMKAPVAWKSFIAAALLWFPEANQWNFAPIEGTAMVDLAFSREEGSAVFIEGQDLSWKGEPFLLHCKALEKGGKWQIPALQVDQCAVSVGAQIEGQTIRLIDGHAAWKTGLEAEFNGVIDSSFQFEFHLPHLRLELDTIDPIAASVGIPLHGLDGIIEGKGMISRKTHLEADFDFGVSDFKFASLDWEKTGPIHLRYASDAGIMCRGLDLVGRGSNLPFLSCKIGLLQFDASRSVWILHHSNFLLPPRFLNHFPSCPSFLMKFNPIEEMHFLADIESPSDFSSLACSIQEASIPFEGTSIPIRNLCLSLDDSSAQTHFEFDHQAYPIKVVAQASFEEILSGRLILEDGDGSLQPGARPLSIDWAFSEPSGLLIREVEGRFGGVEASFHALDAGTSLIGSARIDFGKASKIIPARIAQVFADLKMGKGYELKGKLFLEKGVSFRGLFTGKQIDLFGYQLRTLLSQFELDPGKVRLYDLKISDSAGMLKIDEIAAAANGDAPWTISIPHLTILELRPSLLQKMGREPQPAGPLVVREMKIDDFKGLLEDSKTYTAKGALTFINSFRREHTVFDIPSDLLGRIVGLDLELLIPACGILHYELKNGLFHLSSLFDSFSEAQRSEFFLVSDPAPTMDLDGNLHILVSMKQFVLFKLTESFQILIDGKLDDPQFHLQKKRRFLGL